MMLFARQPSGVRATVIPGGVLRVVVSAFPSAGLPKEVVLDPDRYPSPKIQDAIGAAGFRLDGGSTVTVNGSRQVRPQDPLNHGDVIGGEVQITISASAEGG